MSKGVTGGTELSWGDVMSAIGSLQAQHEVKISCTIVPSPMGTRSLSVLLLARPAPVRPYLDAVPDGRSWSLTFDLASTDTRRLEPLVYRTVLELDELLTRQRWQQLALPS